jgi:hypothetical protein
MGFKREKKTYRLVWGPENPDMDGLVVEVRTVPVGTLMTLAALVDKVVRTIGEDAKTVNDLLGGFAKALVSWNLEEDDDEEVTHAVPATLDGVLAQDIDFMVAIIRAWIGAHVEVPDELGKDSPSGGTSLEGSLPMEPLSSAPTN